MRCNLFIRSCPLRLSFIFTDGPATIGAIPFNISLQISTSSAFRASSNQSSYASTLFGFALMNLFTLHIAYYSRKILSYLFFSIEKVFSSYPLYHDRTLSYSLNSKKDPTKGSMYRHFQPFLPICRCENGLFSFFRNSGIRSAIPFIPITDKPFSYFGYI